MRSLLGAGHKHSLGIRLDTIVKTHCVWMRMTAKGDPRAVTILLWGGCRAFVLFLFWVVYTSLVCAAMHRGKQGTEELNDACVCWCVSAGWYYYQLNARVGWMASVLSLEHSLFTLINTTLTPLQPIVKRAFAYWCHSKARNHLGYEYTREQCWCLTLLCAEQFLWMLTCQQ